MNIKKYTQEFAHLASEFECGNTVIDKFLKSGNALDSTQGITYVLLSDEEILSSDIIILKLAE